MSAPPRAGLTRTETVRVDTERTIAFLGDAHRVYSTPSMVNDVEYACWRLLEQHQEPGWTSVGVEVSMQHLGPTPEGEDVQVVVRIEAVEGRRVSFSAEVHDRVGVVGRALHERALVNLARHRARIEARQALSGDGQQ